MELFFGFFEKNFPLILSTLVSLAAIFVTKYQVKMAHKTKTTELYFTAQLTAYQNLLDAFCEIEKDFPSADTASLIGAAQKAMLLSTNRNAEIISHFCTVYIELINTKQSGGAAELLDAEFAEWKTVLETFLRDEMFRFDTMKRKSDKYFKDKQKNKNKN